MKSNALPPDAFAPAQGPISPTQALEMKISAIPAFIFDIVNEQLATEYSGSRTIIKLNDVMNAVTERMSTMPEYAKLFPPGEGLGADDRSSKHPTARKHVFAARWMDFEDAYRAAGWLVNFDKPGYNESYDAFYEFEAVPARRKTDKR